MYLYNPFERCRCLESEPYTCGFCCGLATTVKHSELNDLNYNRVNTLNLELTYEEQLSRITNKLNNLGWINNGPELFEKGDLSIRVFLIKHGDFIRHTRIAMYTNNSYYAGTRGMRQIFRNISKPFPSKADIERNERTLLDRIASNRPYCGAI